jgi:hypothetical protein
MSEPDESDKLRQQEMDDLHERIDKMKADREAYGMRVAKATLLAAQDWVERNSRELNGADLKVDLAEVVKGVK